MRHILFARPNEYQASIAHKRLAQTKNLNSKSDSCFCWTIVLINETAQGCVFGMS